MGTPFRYETLVRLRDTDAAGVIYFANQFVMVHEAYEHWLASVGCRMVDLLGSWDTVPLIARAESDYRAAVRVSDELVLEMRCTRLSKRSYTLVTDLLREGRCVGTTRMVHVAVDRKTGKTGQLPEKLAEALRAIEASGTEA